MTPGSGSPVPAAPAVSVIVPFHRNREYLARCLGAVRVALDQLPAASELIVVADGAPEDCSDIVRLSGGVVLPIPGPSGPAVARNRGAAMARAEILVFVDSDVVVHADAVERIIRVLEPNPDLGAVFGAYDEEPAHPGFLSQGRNLAHSFVHQRGNREASTFWAGLGAVRRSAFFSVDGFDERFRRPSVEDIDLGYRLRGAGYRIALEHTIRGKHLKHWTTWNSLRTDVRDRGIPWTQLLHRYSSMRDDLNVSRAYRACVAVAYLAVALAAAAFSYPLLLVPLGVCLIVLVWLDVSYYAFFMRRCGLVFTVRWYFVHVMHHLLNGLSFVAGTALFFLTRVGIRGPWSLPVHPWDGGVSSTRTAPQSS